MPRLSVGVARTDITPPVGIAHAGWGAQDHERAAGVDLPLHATALALDDGEEAAVIVDIDLVYVWEEDARRVREAVAELTGLPESNVRLSYTHTHSGPFTPRDSWIEAGSEMVDRYLDALPHRVAGAAWEALEKARPGRLAAGTGECSIAINRRFPRPEDGRILIGLNPEGPVDHDVGVLRFDDTDANPIATVAHYACHPTTVGPDNELLTPDFPGVTRQVVEEATDSTCLFLQGPAGNVGPIRGTARGGINEYRSLGHRLGHEVSRVYFELDPMKREQEYAGTLESGAPLAIFEDHENPDDPTLEVATRDLALPVRDLPPLETTRREYEDAAERRDRLRESSDGEVLREATMQAKRAKIRLDIAEKIGDSEHISFELQGFALGDVALLAMPGEPFVDIGRRIKADSPFEYTLFSGYSNVGHCYVPTDDDFPDGGYEVDRTPVRPTAADVVIQESLELLGELRD